MNLTIPLDKIKALLDKLAFAPVIPALCISFALGILLARGAHPPIVITAGFSVATLAAALILQPRLASFFLPLVAAAAFFAGAFLFLVDEAVSPDPRLTRILRTAEAKKQTLFIEAIVENSPTVDNEKARFNIRVTDAGIFPDRMQKISGIARVTTNSDRRLPHYSDRVRFEALASSLDFMDPTYQQHFKTLGVSGFLFIPEVIQIRLTGRARKFFLFRWGNALGERFRTTIRRTIPEPASLVLSQMMFGKAVRIPLELKDKFRDAGIVHILVVSGLHVWMMLSSFMLLAFLWKRNPFISFTVLGIVLLLFFAMSGGGPSVTRATIMGLVYLGAMLGKRDYDRATALFAAGLFLLVLSPKSLFHPGLQLSFLACAGLIFIYPSLSAILPKYLRSRPISLLFISICAQLPIYPVIAYQFNTISIVSPITNLFVVPLAAILIPFGFVYSVAALILPKTTIILAPVLTLLINALIAIVDWFAALPFSSIAVARPGFATLLLYFIALVSWAMFIRSMKRGRDEAITSWMVAGSVGTCILLWSWLFLPPSNLLKVTFIDVGQGDSIVIDAPYDLNSHRRFRMLIDGGGNSPRNLYDPGKEHVGRTLAQNGISHLDAILLTHPDHDHMEGLLWVLDNIPVDRWIDPGFLGPCALKNTDELKCFYTGLQTFSLTENFRKSASRDIALPTRDLSSQLSTYKSLLEKVKNKDIERIIARKSAFWELKSGISFHILYPDDDDMILSNQSLNELSVVLKLTYKNASFLFTGDIEKYGEFTLLNTFYNNLSSTVLKVPHHGSSTSSSTPFIEAVRPLFSIISAGRKNQYGHPHYKTIKHYKKIKSSVFRTDKHGNIAVATDGKRLVLKTEIDRVFVVRDLDEQ